MKTPNKLTKEEKIKSYLAKNDNPYCFLSGKTRVTMCFSESSRTIENQMRQYLIARSKI